MVAPGFGVVAEVGLAGDRDCAEGVAVVGLAEADEVVALGGTDDALPLEGHAEGCFDGVGAAFGVE